MRSIWASGSTDAPGRDHAPSRSPNAPAGGVYQPPHPSGIAQERRQGVYTAPQPSGGRRAPQPNGTRYAPFLARFRPSRHARPAPPVTGTPKTPRRRAPAVTRAQLPPNRPNAL